MPFPLRGTPPNYVAGRAIANATGEPVILPALTAVEDGPRHAEAQESGSATGKKDRAATTPVAALVLHPLTTHLDVETANH
jgi:hypothetical protein